MTAFIFDRRNPARLLVASDTLGYTPHVPPKPFGFTSKCWPVPHLRGVLLGRGAIRIGITAAAQLMAAPLVVTFAEVVAALPEILREATDAHCAQMGIAEPDKFLLFEGLWAGWNEAERRTEIIAFRNYEGFGPVPDNLARTISSLPDLAPEYVPAGLAGLPADRVLVALMQAMRKYLADHPEVVPAIIGGEVIINEISETGVSSRIVHRFPDFAQMRTAAAAVRARIERGEDEVDIVAGLSLVDDADDADDNPPAPRRELSRNERRALRRAGRAA